MNGNIDELREDCTEKNLRTDRTRLFDTNALLTLRNIPVKAISL